MHVILVSIASQSPDIRGWHRLLRIPFSCLSSSSFSMLFNVGANAPLAFLAFHIACSQASTFFPLINMTDTAGNLIQAHGGNIIRSQDASDPSWYWFGEDKTGQTSGGTFQGVNCYKSADLGTWEYQGHVLEPVAGGNISSERIVERPKVIYNDKNQEYVMWFHGDSSNYGAVRNTQ